MYGKANKPGTLQTAQMMCEKGNLSVVADCITRKMTPEDWEKYGPLSTRGCKKFKKAQGNSWDELLQRGTFTL